MTAFKGMVHAQHAIILPLPLVPPPFPSPGHFSNALTLFLGIKPAPLFFFLFLPPLLLDSAVRIDYFIFKRVSGICRLTMLKCDSIDDLRPPHAPLPHLVTPPPS